MFMDIKGDQVHWPCASPCQGHGHEHEANDLEQGDHHVYDTVFEAKHDHVELGGDEDDQDADDVLQVAGGSDQFYRAGKWCRRRRCR